MHIWYVLRMIFGFGPKNIKSGFLLRQNIDVVHRGAAGLSVNFSMVTCNEKTQ